MRFRCAEDGLSFVTSSTAARYQDRSGQDKIGPITSNQIRGTDGGIIRCFVEEVAVIKSNFSQYESLSRYQISSLYHLTQHLRVAADRDGLT